MSHKTFAIDFGTDTLKIYQKGKGIIYCEKDIVAVTGKVKVPIESGDKAYEMYEKAPDSIQVNFPLQHGVVADMEDMYCLWKHVFKQISGKKHMKGANFYIAVPSDITEVEKRAFYDLMMLSETKARTAVIINKPIADAFGVGIDVPVSRGAMIVNIGGDTTEISIISLGGIVVSRLIPIGGNQIDESILSYIKKKYNFVIGHKTACQIKKELVEAYETEGTYTVAGRNVVNGLPEQITIHAEELYDVVKEHFHTLVESARMILERTPPEISADIMEDGIYLTGGGANIPQMDKLFTTETDLKVNICDAPENSVINGLKLMIETPRFASYLEAKRERKA